MTTYEIREQLDLLKEIESKIKTGQTDAPSKELRGISFLKEMQPCRVENFDLVITLKKGTRIQTETIEKGAYTIIVGDGVLIPLTPKTATQFCEYGYSWGEGVYKPYTDYQAVVKGKRNYYSLLAIHEKLADRLVNQYRGVKWERERLMRDLAECEKTLSLFPQTFAQVEEE